jgi:hypothetical protein
VVHYKGKHIGELTYSTNSALLALERFKDIKQELIVDQSKLEMSFTAWKSSSSKIVNLEYELNIYGPVNIKEAVGNALSDAKVYLQSPLSMIEGVKLDNPHWIGFPNLVIGEKNSKIWLTPSLTAAETSATSELDVHQIFEGLDGHENLALESTDDSVVSTLLEYILCRNRENITNST